MLAQLLSKPSDYLMCVECASAGLGCLSVAMGKAMFSMC
jgi:hypothetical protein